MKTFNLKQAADFLHMHSVTLSDKIRAGEIPAVKLAKRWVLIEDDLVQYIRVQYRQPVPVPPVLFGTPETRLPFISDKAYLRALGLTDCPQIHSPKPGARSGASHADAACRVAREAVELVGKSGTVAQSKARMTQGT